MPWGRIDDEAWHHPKFEALQEQGIEGMAAIGLWAMAISLTGAKCNPLFRLKEAAMLCDGDQELAEKLFALLKQNELIDDNSASKQNPKTGSENTPKTAKQKGEQTVIHDWADYRSKDEAKRLAGRKGGVISGKTRRSKREANPEAETHACFEAEAQKTRTPDPDPDPGPDPGPDPDPVYISESLRDSSPELNEPNSVSHQTECPDSEHRAPESGLVSLREPSSASLGEPDLLLSSDNHAKEIKAVFAHYRKYHPRAHPKPTSKSKEWVKIKARLIEGYKVEDLCLAIDGCHQSPFHQGENDRGKHYDSLELIVRDGSKVNNFIEITERPDPVISEGQRRGHRAAEQWLRYHEEKDRQEAAEVRRLGQEEKDDAEH
jgi:hypothetical protein